MTREEELRKTLAGLVKHDLAGVGLDDDLVRELGLDSLAGLRVLAAVEKRFGLRFPDDRLGEFRTLRDILRFVEESEKKVR